MTEKTVRAKREFEKFNNYALRLAGAINWYDPYKRMPVYITRTGVYVPDCPNCGACRGESCLPSRYLSLDEMGRLEYVGASFTRISENEIEFELEGEIE